MDRIRFDLYERADGKWAWRLVAGNGEIIATDHGQGFRDATDASRAVQGVVTNVLTMIGAEDYAEALAQYPSVPATIQPMSGIPEDLLL